MTSLTRHPYAQVHSDPRTAFCDLTRTRQVHHAECRRWAEGSLTTQNWGAVVMTHGHTKNPWYELEYARVHANPWLFML